MKILLIHLSDIHIKSGENSVQSKIDKLYEAVRNSTKELAHIFLVISGDTAFSGQANEYRIAKKLILKLKSDLENYCNKKIHVIIIPGNHDCDFSLDTKARKNQISHIQRYGDDSLDESVIEQCSGIQNEYFKFAYSVNDNKHQVNKSKLIDTYKYDLENFKITFYCYNTAYMSEMKEQPGKMLFPVFLLPPNLTENKTDLSISLFHHPSHWLNPNNRRVFLNHIQNSSDFYLTGHEHEYSKTMLDDLDSNVVYHIEGGALQDSDDDQNSTFSLIAFDVDQQKFKLRKYAWKENKYQKGDELDWTTYKRGRQKLDLKYQPNENFKKFLNDIGGNFSHPTAQSKIILRDLYVFPKLRVFNSSVERTTDSISYLYEESEAIIKNIKNNSRLVFFGEETIGKTALLKTLYSFLNSQGMIPIFLEGTSINKSSVDEVKKIVRRNFLNQYEESEVEDFENEDLSKVFILIDDVDKCPMTQKNKGKLIKSLISYYENIILVGNELITIQEIISDEMIDADLYSTFKHYEILELNHSKKSALIYKWYNLGRDDSFSEELLWKKHDNAYKAIQVAMGNRMVPNYPIYVLILLQTIETASSHDLRISSYGSYYQLLIMKSVTDKIKDQSDQVLYRNYASELAYYYFKNNMQRLSLNEFLIFHKELTSEDNFDLPLVSYEKALTTLCNVGILDSYNDEISFKYKYSYYYFVAQHLANNVQKKEIKEKISLVCKNLYRTEFANILLFLIQFTYDDFILEQILSYSTEIFKGFAPSKLEEDINNIHALVTELPKIYLKNKSIKENREEEDEVLDSIENTQSDLKDGHLPEYDEDYDESEIDVFSQINVAMKLIEIIGQILKNNHGRMLGQVKYALLKEAYSLGLRSMNVLFTILNENTDFLVNQFKKALPQSENASDEDKMEKIARRLLFSLSTQISLVFLRKISDSVASNKFADKYSKILAEYNFTSVHIANFLVQLDIFTNFPFSELENLQKVVHKHTLSNFLLKRIVLNYLHRHEVSYKDRQRICNFLDIPVESQLKLYQEVKDNTI